MLVTTSVWKWFLWCNIGLWWWTHPNTQVCCFFLQSIFENIIVWPAYTSLGHGQNFVQKDWVNGLSSHAPDEERIGSTIFECIFGIYLFFKIILWMFFLDFYSQRWNISCKCNISCDHYKQTLFSDECKNAISHNVCEYAYIMPACDEW